MRRWHKVWLAWVIFGIAADTVAYTVDSKDATLSEFLRRTLSLTPNTKTRRAGQVFVTGFLGWLAIHLIFDVAPPLPKKLCADARKEIHREEAQFKNS